MYTTAHPRFPSAYDSLESYSSLPFNVLSLSLCFSVSCEHLARCLISLLLLPSGFLKMLYVQFPIGISPLWKQSIHHRLSQIVTAEARGVCSIAVSLPSSFTSRQPSTRIFPILEHQKSGNIISREIGSLGNLRAGNRRLDCLQAISKRNIVCF